ncbi:MAG: hypothetical protein BGO61_07690 [Thiobacillus sp. 65-69]|jgi:uncharacterized protein YjgD (DUF1641 family)|nr:MAG: hypothetical protein ABT21_01510 [Thiobacillus sp. SCN 65-179]OJW35832.1 MAG: hypothetical protein BGO61_07690 [Thiobacillus sp. 65-69]
MSNETGMPAATLSAKDLQQLAEVASIITAARDAMSDDIVSRVAGAMSEGIILLDRLTRNDGLMRLLQVLDRKESQQLLVALADAMHAASQDIAAAPPATGGIGCMLRVARDPGTQEGVRLLSVIGKHLSESLREQHHRGG